MESGNRPHAETIDRRLLELLTQSFLPHSQGYALSLAVNHLELLIRNINQRTLLSNVILRFM